MKASLLPGGNVTELAVKGGIWVGITNVVNRIIQLTKIVILANLLPPVEFGLLGIGFLVLGALRSFSLFGIGQKLIQQSEEDIDPYLNTAFTIGVLRGLVLFSAMYIIAPYAANFFGEPRAVEVIRVLGLMPLILGLANPGVIYFHKHLQFHKQTIYELSGTSVNFIFAVATGVILKNVWALVLGSIAGTLITFFVSYLLHGYRPKLGIEREYASEFVDYGKWIFGSSVLVFLIFQGDDTFVGWYLGAAALGFYQMAYRFSNAPATEITEVISRVLLPSYSKVQTDQAKLRKAFYRTTRFSSFISFPAAVGILVVSPVFVPAFLGPQWKPIIPVLQVLAIWGILRSLEATTIPLFRATGRPDIETKVKLAKLVVIIILIFPATERFGLVGTGGTIVASAVLVSVPISLLMTIKIVNGSLIELSRLLGYPLVGCAVMGAVVWSVFMTFSFGMLIVDFLVFVLIGVAVYAVYTSIVISMFGYKIGGEFRTIWASLEH